MVQPDEERRKLEDKILTAEEIDLAEVRKESQLIKRGVRLQKTVRDVQNFTYFDKRYNIDKNVN